MFSGLLLIASASSVLLGEVPSSSMSWRDVPAPVDRHETIRLTDLVPQLAANTCFPIHLLCYPHGPADLVLRDIDIHDSTSLGDVFDVVAKQIPGIQAKPTKKGVLWIAPMQQQIMDAFQEKIQMASYDGTLEGFMHYVFANRFSGFGWSSYVASRTDAEELQISIKPSSNVSLIDMLVQSIEDQDACLYLKCSDFLPDRPTVRNNFVMPSLYFVVGDIRKE